MKSFWKNPHWHVVIGILVLAVAALQLGVIYDAPKPYGMHEFMNIVRLIIFVVYGTSRLMKWQKLRKINSTITNEKDL